MFTSPANRAAAAYRTLDLQGHLDGASPHQLVQMLFDALAVSLGAARRAMLAGDVELKGRHLGKAVRLIEEGLKGGLDMQRGGELAGNLRGLYDYCVQRLTHANLHNDEAAVAEVVGLLDPVAQAWKAIASQQPAAGA
ncbi:MAG: flagellar export chaperone FliS [Burkholderiales bacterium]|jgi:flagellar protein FliS|nr:flagellar export chaperone FliS [Burkholderiales bacterium]